MPVRIIVIAAAAVLTVAALLISATNLTPVALSLFGTNTAMPPAVLVLLGYLAGAACAYSIAQSRVKEIQNEKKLIKWDSEDAKLASEVQADYVKQLEAKNATLDAALKAALKKKS